MNYIIRRAKPEDLDEIIILYEKLSNNMAELQQKFINIPKKNLDYCNENKKNYFRTILNSNNNAIFVAQVENQNAGFIQTSINEKDFDFYLDKYCYIPYYYVEKIYRNFSLNINLYKEAEKWAYEKKLQYICSDVDGGNDTSLTIQEKFCGMKPFKIRLMKQL